MEEENTNEQPISPTTYLMNNVSIVQMVKKNLRYKGIKKFKTDDMRREYFDIVVKKKLESQEWIDYFKELYGY